MTNIVSVAVKAAGANLPRDHWRDIIHRWTIIHVQLHMHLQPPHLNLYAADIVM